MSTTTAKVGIGVTTRDRRDIFDMCMDHVRLHAPPGAVIVTVDDASTVPVPGATYRFDVNAGIARAKNKCLELLVDAGCEHLFLFDDDTWPTADGWWVPYVESPEPHLMYLFEHFATGRRLGDSRVVWRDSAHVAMTHGRGCMLYLDARCIDAVGGYDTQYGLWGFEHLDLSSRIHHSGLTTWRYADVTGSRDLVHSMDEWEMARSSVPTVTRRAGVKTGGERHCASLARRSDRWCEWREQRDPGECVVIAAYLCTRPDEQRGRAWTPDARDLDVLARSVAGHGRRLVVLHDCLDGVVDTDLVQWVRVESGATPYWARYVASWQWLRAHPGVDRVWCVDATDVEMLRDPFPGMSDDRLFVGSEAAVLGIPWMRQNFRYRPVAQFIARNPKLPLLNNGLIGGHRSMVMDLLHRMVSMWQDSGGDAGPLDMGVFNYIARTVFDGQFVTGDPVHTRFRGMETGHPTAWWRHK